MAWTAPTTRATGYLVLASDWNNEHVNNLKLLHGDSGNVDLSAGGAVYTMAALAFAGLTGATAASRDVGGTAGGPPVSGTFATGDMITDQKGYTWICTAAGTPGTWKGPGSLAAAAISTPANPTGTSSATAKMMGLSSGASFVTPNSSRLMALILGNFSQATASSTGGLHARYGTGNGPANGAALTGTVIGNTNGLNFNLGTSDLFSFAAGGIITGLTAGTGVWIDLDLFGDGTHVASVSNLTMFAFDLL